MFFLFVLTKDVRVMGGEHDTLIAIWMVLTWSFTACFHGLHPTLDPWGQPITGARLALAGQPLCASRPLRAVIWVVAGDMDYLANEIGLPNQASESPCAFCFGNKGDKNIFDFRPGSAWRAACYSAEQTRAMAPLHPVLTVPGCVYECFHLDCLHVLEYGPVAHSIGNLCADICYEELQMNKGKALLELNKRIVDIQCKFKIPSAQRGAPLDYNDFCPSRQQYPIFTHWKASKIRYFVPVALELGRQLKTSDGYAQHRHAVFAALDEIYAIIDEYPLRYPLSVSAKLTSAFNAALLRYAWLAKHAARSGQLRWSMVPKHHYAAHMPAQAVFLAIKATWCYGGESLVGKGAVLAHACSSGTPSHKIFVAFLKKYMVAMHLRFTLDFDVE